MKCFALILLIAPLFATSSAEGISIPLAEPLVTAAPAEFPEDYWDKLAWAVLGLGVVSVATIAIPPLSLVGLVCGALAFGLSWVVRKKAKRRWVVRLGRWLGAASLGYFLLGLGLVLFF